MSFQLRQNILRWPRLILPLPNLALSKPLPRPLNTLVHLLNKRIHYRLCSTHGMVSFNMQIWNRIIVALGYWNGAPLSGSGPHINLPCLANVLDIWCLTRSWRRSHVFLPLFLVLQQAAAGPCQDFQPQRWCAPPSWPTTGKASAQHSADYSVVRMSRPQ